MVSHPLQLFPPVPHSATNLGCIDDFRRWACYATCYSSGAVAWIIQYVSPFSETKILDRLKNVDFERGMKLVTGRIDVQDDDRLMRLVFQEALENGALKFEF